MVSRVRRILLQLVDLFWNLDLKVRWERHHLFSVKTLVDHFMKRFGLYKVLIIDVTSLCGVDPDKVVFPAIFYQSVS